MSALRSPRLVTILTCLGILGLLGPGPAAGEGRPDRGGPQWSAGLGVISSPRPYVGAADEVRLVPIVDLEVGRFYFRGLEAGWQLVERGSVRLDLVGRANLGGYDGDDSVLLRGMEDRRETFESGLALTWDRGGAELEAALVADSLGRSDGVQASVGWKLKRVFQRGRAGLFPGVGVTWQSSDFVDYYAGVRPEEARPGRPAFTAGSGFNLEVSLAGFVALSEKARFIGLFRAQRFSDDFEASPIVDSRESIFGLAAVTYSF